MSTLYVSIDRNEIENVLKDDNERRIFMNKFTKTHNSLYTLYLEIDILEEFLRLSGLSREQVIELKNNISSLKNHIEHMIKLIHKPLLGLNLLYSQGIPEYNTLILRFRPGKIFFDYPEDVLDILEDEGNEIHNTTLKNLRITEDELLSDSFETSHLVNLITYLNVNNIRVSKHIQTDISKYNTDNENVLERVNQLKDINITLKQKIFIE